MFINNIQNPTLNFQILQYKYIKEIFFWQIILQRIWRESGSRRMRIEKEREMESL